ncbi:MAG: hypothetical protein RI953_707 [Pseudomonadota bacterium]
MKYAKLLKISALFAVTGTVIIAGAALAQRYSKIREEFSFDLSSRLKSQATNQSRLNSLCVKGKVAYCFDAVSAATAWNSRFDDIDAEILNHACGRGDKRACRHSSELLSAKKSKSELWSKPEMFGQLIQPTARSWPRILLLNETQSYRRWLELSYAALLHSGTFPVDLICGRTVEFPDAFVCAATGSQQLNAALGRMAYLVEQTDAEPFSALDDGHKVLLARFWQGYDLLRSDFVSGVERLKAAGQLRAEESALSEFLLQRDWNFFIAFNVFSVFSGIPSHEFLHGAYFSSAEYREKVAKAVTRFPLKTLPLLEFVKSVYKTQSQFILNNEVQAYAFQAEFSDRKNELWNSSVSTLWSEVGHILKREKGWSDFVRGFEIEN